MIIPPIPTLSPVCTSMRVDRLRACAGGVGVGVTVGVGIGVKVAVAVAVAVLVAEAVAVGVAVAVAVAVDVPVGVGDGVAQGAPETKMVSTRQPVALTLLSDAIRKRSLIVCPFRFGPRFATVLV